MARQRYVKTECVYDLVLIEFQLLQILASNFLISPVIVTGERTLCGMQKIALTQLYSLLGQYVRHQRR